MSNWNHRVIKSIDEFDVVLYQIHEVHYNQAGEITMYTKQPIAASGETLEDLRWELEHMLKCLDKPILETDKIILAKPDWDKNAPTIPYEEVMQNLDINKNDA